MKKLIVIAIIAIAAYVLYRSSKNRTGSGLGKITRPPKLRIVYSKKIPTSKRPKITSSDDAVKLFREIWSSQMEIREEFVVLLLDRSNRVLGYQLLSVGGLTGTVADVRLIYAVALEALAASIIISHNHPSGNTQPSDADIRLTEKIKKAGANMDIPVLDHIIITKESHYSFADGGIL